MPEPTPEERYADLAAALAQRPGVGLPGEGGRRGFGSTALTVGGSIFAMLTQGRLVVKLPRTRVTELIGSGAGEPFDAGKGTPMKEWLVVREAADDDAWRQLAGEALAFVGARTPHG